MQNFIARLLRATPRTWGTQLIIGINIAAFLLAWLLGVSPISPTAQELLNVGGNYLPATVQQPWRLLSATVLHAGVVHIGFNMWALHSMGSIAERFYGNAQFLVIYGFAGLFGSLSSLFFSAQTSVSVGASGAVFGVAGAILAAVYTKPNKLPPELVTPIRRSMVIFVAYSLFMGFATSFIDNSAHIGGLLSGFLMAWVMVERFDWEAFRHRAMSRAVAAIVTAMVIAFLMWRLVPIPAN